MKKWPPFAFLGSPLMFPVVFGVIHMLIDASTVMVVFSTRAIHGLSGAEGFYLIMTYDVLAFAGQWPLGLFIDRLSIWRGTAIVGIALAALSILFLELNPIAAMIAAGAGNAAFHVGAGALSLHVTPGRATAPGIFVAPGVLGLAAGTMIGKSGVLITWPFLLALALALFVAFRATYPKVESPRPFKTLDISAPWTVIFILLFSIAIRSFVGKAGTYAAPKETMVLLGLASAAFAGKAMGGVLSDRLGWIRVSVAALLISAPMLAFGAGYPTMVIIGMFIFQMTMPVTMVAIASIIPGRPGLAFGLNCVAYILGFLLHMFRLAKPLYTPVNFFVLILVSAAAVYFGLSALKGKVPMRFDGDGG